MGCRYSAELSLRRRCISIRNYICLPHGERCERKNPVYAVKLGPEAEPGWGRNPNARSGVGIPRRLGQLFKTAEDAMEGNPWNVFEHNTFKWIEFFYENEAEVKYYAMLSYISTDQVDNHDGSIRLKSQYSDDESNDGSTEDEDNVISASATRTPVPEIVPDPEVVFNSMNEVVSSSMNNMILDHPGMVYDEMNFTWVPGHASGQVEYNTDDEVENPQPLNGHLACSSEEEDYVPDLDRY